MQAVAHLVALSVETDVAQGAAAQGAVEPVGEDALVGAPELAGAGEDSAAVYIYGEVEGFAVFERECFGGEFGGAVERDGREGGESFGDSSRGYSEEERGVDGGAAGAVVGFDGERGKRGDGIDAAGAEEDKAGFMLFAVFEEVDGAGEVVFDELAGLV
jgi:hypothetical protein